MFLLDTMINICHITIDAWFCLYLLTLSNSSSLMNLKISVTLLSQKDISCVWLQSPVLTDASSCFLLLWYQSPHLRSPATEQMNWISCNYLKTMSRPTTLSVDSGLSAGCPKKIGILSSFEILGLGGVFLGVKNNSKNFGNKKIILLFSKILSK